MRTNRSARGFAIALALAATFLSGCATESVRVTPASHACGPIGELTLGGIELESIYTYTESLDEIESIIVAAASREGILIAPRNAATGAKTADGTIASDGSDARYTITFFIREQGYTKGFQAMLSLAILAEIRDGEGKTILRAEYFHDGEESFDSIGFLTSSLGATFKKISHASRKAG